MELTARVHQEDGSYWAEVLELPGCFASGQSLDELREALEEAVALCLDDQSESAGSSRAGAPRATLRVGEMKVLV
jgi:predicted RNase H-like HicB family nuclease